MQIRIDERLKVSELAGALANAGLVLRYRDGQIVLTRAPLSIHRARAPLSIHRDVPAFLRPQAG